MNGRPLKRLKLTKSKQVSHFCINLFPQDVLLEIFQYLDMESLRSAITVCKIWSECIKSSTLLTNNMEINVKYSSEGAEKFKIEVPIEGLKYKTLKISGSTSLDYGKEEFIISNKICLQSIQTVIFDDFGGSCEFLQKISNLKHLKILKRFCDYWTFDLNNLTHLELMLEDLRDTKILQDQNLKLFSLKISLISKKVVTEDELQNIQDVILKQKNTLKELRVIGTVLGSELFSKVLEMKFIKKIEVEAVNLFEAKLCVLSTILKQNNWSFAEFVNLKVLQKDLLEDLIQNTQGLKSLKITYKDSGCSLPFQASIFEEIPNFKSGKIVFSGDKVDQTLKSFKCLQKLAIKRLDNESQVLKLINFLETAKNVKILHLNLVSSRAKLDKHIKNLLKVSGSLEELYIDAYSDQFDIPKQTFEEVKKNSRILKKLIIKIGSRRVKSIRENSKILLCTRIQVIVMEKDIKPTCLGNCVVNRDEESSVCYLRK